MARLENPRHEAFAQYLHEGYSAYEAYQLAGNKANYGNAIRLKRKERIQARVAELDDRAKRTADVTLHSLTQMYFEAHRTAQKKSDAQAMRGVADSLAKLYGLWVDKSENRTTLTHEDALQALESAVMDSATNASKPH